ncbi:formylmethanofuran dehydrogenase, subunit E [Thermoplasmatales archaeon BRNA1]|nr:formylmethanofuran dehydrogenase, subunit E [Thermoplasmatales archaeon BRNA1]
MDKVYWERCQEFHGHGCPGLATGCRAAYEAARILGIPLETARDEEIVCVTENDACGIDAIQRLLGCTLGKGSMIMRMRGKAAYSFFDRRSGKKVRLVAKFDRSIPREELIELILNGPLEQVFDVKEPKFDLPEKARMFDSKKCDCCGEWCREDLVRFQDGKIVCLDCFRDYSVRW